MSSLVDAGSREGYNPDFDSQRREKEAATLVNTGFAAHTFYHKYVGDRSFFTAGQDTFNISAAKPFTRKINTESSTNGIRNLTSVVE